MAAASVAVEGGREGGGRGGWFFGGRRERREGLRVCGSQRRAVSSPLSFFFSFFSFSFFFFPLVS